jgi:hypothetical protein
LEELNRCKPLKRLVEGVGFESTTFRYELTGLELGSGELNFGELPSAIIPIAAVAVGICPIPT